MEDTTSRVVQAAHKKKRSAVASVATETVVDSVVSANSSNVVPTDPSSVVSTISAGHISDNGVQSAKKRGSAKEATVEGDSVVPAQPNTSPVVAERKRQRITFKFDPNRLQEGVRTNGIINMASSVMKLFENNELTESSLQKLFDFPSVDASFLQLLALGFGTLLCLSSSSSRGPSRKDTMSAVIAALLVLAKK